MSHILDILHKKWLIIAGLSIILFIGFYYSLTGISGIKDEAKKEEITKFTPSITLSNSPTIYPTITSTRQTEVIAGTSGTLQISSNNEMKKEITQTAASTSMEMK